MMDKILTSPGGELFPQILQNIFNTIHTKAAWKFVCQDFFQLFNASDVFICLSTRDHEPIFTASQKDNADAIIAYWKRDHKKDPWHQKCSVLEEGLVQIGSELLEREELEQSDYYKMFAKPLNMEKLLTVNFYLNDSYRAFIVIFRGRESTNFTSTDKFLLQQFLIPLKMAILSNIELKKSKVLQNYIDNDWLGNYYGFAIFILDRHTRVIHSNEYAERLLKNNSSLTLSNGKFNYRGDPIIADKFELFLGHIAGSNSKSKSIQELSTIPIDGQYFRLIALQSSEFSNNSSKIKGNNQASCLLILQDRQQSKAILDKSYLKMAYSLTPAEMIISEGISLGFGLKGIAHVNAKSISTIRTQLKSIFEKTGTKTQASLTRLLINECMYRVARADIHENRFYSPEFEAEYEII